MHIRVAFVASDCAVLCEKLNSFIRGETGIGHVIGGESKPDQDVVRLARQWVVGEEVDWDGLYNSTETRPRRISAPTYPFAEENYWPANLAINSPLNNELCLFHPLLHRNISDFSGQRYVSEFHGNEFFLADHQVQGRKILPGVAYLEMARAAVEASAGIEKSKETVLLRNIVWARPITVDANPISIEVILEKDAGNRISYEVRTSSEANNDSSLVHSRGTAEVVVLSQPPILDLDEVSNACKEHSLSSAECYDLFFHAGVNYGPTHRGIDTLHFGADVVLVRLALPEMPSTSLQTFHLHPSILDSAFQAAVIGMQETRTPEERQLSLPFALERLESFAGCSQSMWGVIRYSQGGKGKSLVEKVDIDLCDEKGRVAVRMQGLSFRLVEAEKADVECLHFVPDWEECPVPLNTEQFSYSERLVVLCEPRLEVAEQFSLANVETFIMRSDKTRIDERFQEYAASLFEEIRRLLKKPKGNILVQLLVPQEGEGQVFSGLSGLLKTASLENPKLIGQTIELEGDDGLASTAIKLIENACRPLDRHIRYSNGNRFVSCWHENSPQSRIGIPWKNEGVYLITGGAGGLGLIFAREITEQAQGAIVILTGRSELSDAKELELRTLGARVEYRRTDITQRDEVSNLVTWIMGKFGRLHGIIHAAGVLRDAFIIKKNSTEIGAVLGPKVAGLVNLDESTRTMSIEFMVLCSSLAGAVGNPGQSDYATANAFMDAYAGYRNALVASGLRSGLTISMNWPLWKNGGMRVDEETQKSLRRTTGLVPLRTSTGIEALRYVLQTGVPRLLLAEGDPQHLRRVVGLNPTSSSDKPEEIVKTGDANSLKSRAYELVVSVLVNIAKLRREKLKSDANLETYGIDSIIQMNIIRELEKVTGDLPKTLLFEHVTIDELVLYLVENHSSQLSRSETFQESKSEGIPTEREEVVSKIPVVEFKDGLHPVLENKRPQREDDDIAIIGISGRYPMANELETFWEVLTAGKNCISEPPRGRWRNSLVQSLLDSSSSYEDIFFGGYLKDINGFDHQLFGFKPEQVQQIPPELRIFLETVWGLFEDAGYSRSTLKEIQKKYPIGVGVFVGTMYSQFAWTMPSIEQAVLASNSSDWQIANRTSHFFDLTGPSIAINSACSSSLTAIHLACESLKQGSCSMAIAGGVNLTLDPSKYEVLRKIQFLGSGNESKSFGTGDGYIPGEGVGAVLLKPLRFAQRDKDRIYAIIKGSYANHSGGRQVYSAPDPKQQGILISESLRKAGIDPSSISYIEGAANGSALGDPIEVVALNSVFKKATDRLQFCAIGSVKSNVGHLEAASGVCQLTKVILQMQHRTLVPSINANPRNPNIRFEKTAFRLQEEASPWDCLRDPKTGKELPRRSLINSFGAGGSYTNLIVEEFVGTENSIENRSQAGVARLFPFSASTRWSLWAYLEKMRDFIEKDPETDIGAVAQALVRTNHNLEYRVAIIASSTGELREKLEMVIQERRKISEEGVYALCNNDTSPGQISYNNNVKLHQIAHQWVSGGTLSVNFGEEVYPQIPIPHYQFDHNIVDEEVVEHLNIVEAVLKGEFTETEFRNLFVIETR